MQSCKNAFQGCPGLRQVVRKDSGNDIGKTAYNQRQEEPETRKRPKKILGRSHASGTTSHTIQSDDLIFKRTIAEGCMTAHEPGQFNINAPGHHTQQVEGNTVSGNATLYCLQ